MGLCHYCRETISREQLLRNRFCPRCNSDLRACKNCVHYDPAHSRSCREPESPWVADRARHTECEYFEPAAAPDPAQPATPSEAEAAKRAAEALFPRPFRD